MPDETEIKPAVADPFDTKTNNDKAAASLLRDQSLAPEADPLSIESLDKLAEARSKENEARDKATPVVEPPVVADDKAAEDAAAEKAKLEREASLKKADDIFKDTPGLPQGASPKSSEAFASIKIRAAQEVSKLQAELETARKEAGELKSSAARPTPEQAAKDKELEELRAWRTKLDVDFDPKFKTFDTAVSKAHEFVYAQLRKSPAVTEDTIKQIQSYGGPDKCNLSKLFEAINDPTLQRIVEGQISDVAKLRYEKEQAVEGAKTNLSQYLAEREKTVQESATSHQKATAAELAQFTGALDWFVEKTPGEKDDETVRKGIEDHNKFVTTLRAQVNEALTDDSPRMRATLITGVAQLFNLQRVHAAVKAELDSTKKAYIDLQSKWEKVKASGRSRLPESGANPGAAPMVKKINAFDTRPSDALDAIAKQVMEERARASAQS